MKKHITIAGAFLLSTAVVAGLSGCSSSEAHGSRAQLYSSVDALASDSSIVVAGTVTEQHTARDVANEGDFTLSTVTVVEAPKSDAAHAPGTSVVVRQIGSSGQPGPAELLSPGKTYLLYLTPSGLSGDLASQFYVTGGTAGLYEAAGVPKTNQRSATTAVTDGTTFTHTDSDEGDSLPSTIVLPDAVD